MALHATARCRILTLVSVSLLAETLMMSSSVFYRWMPSVVGLAALLVFTVLYNNNHDLYIDVLTWIGTNPYSYPFIDGQFMYAMKTCWQLGYDIYTAVPCDVIPGNKMAYSPLWPRLPFLPTHPDWAIPIGVATGVLLILSVSLVLPAAQTLRDSVLMSLATVSTMVVFAIERNNIDVWIYILLSVSMLLIRAGHCGRWVGYGLVLICGLLKYYPLAALIVTLNERLMKTLGFAFIALATMGLFVWSFYDEIARSLVNLPTGNPYSNMVGLMNIPKGLLSEWTGQDWTVGPQGIFAAFAILVLVLAALSYRTARRASFVTAFDTMSPNERMWLVLGCSIMGPCYVLLQNVGYRGVYLLPVLAGLIAMRRASPPSLKGWLGVRAGILVILMWFEGLRQWVDWGINQFQISAKTIVAIQIELWVLREVGWICIAEFMVAVLIAFVLRSQAWTDLRSMWTGRMLARS